MQAPPARAVAGARTFPLWGGLAVVQSTDPERAPAAHAAVASVVDRVDRACSRFRGDSELSRLNAAAGTAVKVGPLLLQAAAAALRAARITGGAVDPTIGQALIALGYDRDLAEIGAGAAPREWSIAPVPGWRTVRLDAERSTIRLPRSVRLDLGATAKALAADLAAAEAHAAAGCGVLVSLSGDISIAGEPPEGGWPVRVTDDHQAGPDAPGQSIVLHTGGLATSSTRARRWHTGSGEAHHLIDPATGAPAREVWRTVSVAAGTCLDANIASTAAIVRPDDAPRWLSAAGLPSRLVRADGAVLHVAGWPAGSEDLPAIEIAPRC